MYPPNSYYTRRQACPPQNPSQQAYPNVPHPTPIRLRIRPKSPSFAPMPVPYNHPQFHNIPNQPVIVHPPMVHLRPQPVMTPPMTHPPVFTQRVAPPMYQRRLSDDSTNFMCLRRNVSVKRELEDDTEEHVKVLIKEQHRLSSSFTGPSISMIMINLPSGIFRILRKLLSNPVSIDDFNANEEEHWIFSFIIKIWDFINWGNVVKKIINAKLHYSGKGDYFNRVLIRLDPEGNCCLPFELAKPIPTPNTSGKGTIHLVSEDGLANTDVYCYDTCTISSANFDFVNSLAGSDKTTTQKILIETIEYNKLNYCLVCETDKPDQSKISLTLENWIEKDKYGLAIRCFSSQLRRLVERINKLAC